MSQYRINSRCQLAIAISSCFAGSVWATGTTADITNSAPDTITVTGHPGSYAEENSVSATRTNTPISEIPQSVQVINRKVMDEQNSQNLSDVLVNVSGVRPIRQDEVLFAQPLVRGFPAEIYLDGLPAFGGTAASIDPSSLTGAERIEVLKGPTSALYGGGIGAPLGGLINVVSKRPEAATEGRVGIRTGSYFTVNPWADVNVPLGERVAARVSGSYEKSNSWIDNVKSRNWFLQPSVSFELSPQTELIFTGQYNRRSQIEYSGLPAALAINGDIDRHAYPGATHGQPRTSIENQVSTLALKHWFNDDTTLNVTGRYFDSKVSDYGSFITDSPDASQPTVYSVSALYLPSHVTESTFDTNLATTIDALGGSHEMMAGVSYDYTNFSSAVSGAVPIGVLDLAHPDYNLSYGSTPETLVTQTNRYQTLAGYLQDQASWGRFHVLGSLRLTQLSLRQAEQDVDITSHRITHRIGLTYDLTDSLAAYTAYSTGFRGAFNFVGMDKPVPETSRNYEMGLKLNQKDWGLTGTLALFQQTRRNVATADPNQELALYGYTVQTGEQRARGVELDMTWEPTPAFSILANYAYTQAEVTEDNSIQPGNGLPRVPRHSGRITARYRIQDGVAKGLGFGAGLTAVSSRELTLPNTVSVPGYAMVDAQTSYDYDRYTVTLSAVNLTGAKAYDSYEYLGLPVVIPVQPRSVYLSLSAHF
ncbi:TonB-dependent siderophore receptor [Serratia sp. BW106]|uniref:TonB-dependent siderophore receptor n=1 Tax=Serratia sp. BW106 TaxID=1884636 RepID=UPI000BFFF3FE|nr:TonB-dependent siderophore receptor [Serratia sp. BW106]